VRDYTKLVVISQARWGCKKIFDRKIRECPLPLLPETGNIL
jgi:hypothetical protein